MNPRTILMVARTRIPQMSTGNDGNISNPFKNSPSSKCSISTFFLPPFSSPFLLYPAVRIIQQQRIAREEVHATVPTLPFLPLFFLRLDTGSVSSSSSFGAQGQTIQQAGSVGLAAGGRPKTEGKEGGREGGGKRQARLFSSLPVLKPAEQPKPYILLHISFRGTRRRNSRDNRRRRCGEESIAKAQG